MPALRLIVVDDRHVIGEDPAEAGVHQLCRALLLGRRIRRGPDFETRPSRVVDLGDRNSHGPSPGLALAPYGRVGWFYVKSRLPAKPVSVVDDVQRRALAACGSPVCFSNRTFRSTATAKVLIFRRDTEFCNVEPKICQY